MKNHTEVQETVIVILLIHILSIYANSLSPTLQQAISSYCPYTDLCQSPARLTKNGNERTSCCAQCSCDNDCWRLDNCCPDKDRSKIHNARALPCKSTLTKDLINNNGITSDIEPRTYKMEDTCPPNEVNITLKQKCQGYIKENLEDFVLVSDQQTGMIYQNRHCAECHGVTYYTQWSIRTSCYELLSQDRSFETTLISDRCDIVNEVPSSEKTRADSFACFIPKYSECNTTGLWDKYDSDIVAACKQYNWTYFQIRELANRVKTYKNVFCFLCNMPANVEIPSDHCIDIDDYLFRKERTAFQDLTLLLDMNTYLESRTQHSSACQVDEVWDSYMNLCRRLTCPFGKRPNFGKCTDIAITFEGLQVEVPLYMVVMQNQSFIQNTNLHPDDMEILGMKLYYETERILNLKMARCFQYGGVVKLDPNFYDIWKGFFVAHWLTLRRKCSLDFIIEQISQLNQKTLTLHIGKNSTLVFNISLYKNDIDMFRTLPGIYTTENTNYKGAFWSVTIDKNTHCPEVNISVTDLRHVKETRAKEGFLSLFDSTEYENNISRTVCVHEYNSVMSQTSHANTLLHILHNICYSCIYVAFCIIFMTNM